MVKLVLCLLSGLFIAAVMLQLRHQRLELAHQSNDLHNKIEQVTIRLWNQQLQIAMLTAPSAIEQTVKQHDLSLVPSKPYVPAKVNPGSNPDAE